MPVYRLTEDDFVPLEETSFEAQQLQEREDIQRRLQDRPEILEEGLFILAEEYGNWEDSKRRIDLLALDSERRLVVIELKRSDQNSFMDLQAIRYAAMVSNMTLDQAIDAHRQYAQEHGIDVEEAYSRVRAHLTDDDGQAAIDSGKPRIILVSADFSKELTTSVLWLNQIDADITCVKLQPWKSVDGVFLESSHVIPIPEAEDYMLRLRNREEEVQRQKDSSNVATFPGSDKFQEALKTAREDRKPMLNSLLELAVDLKKEKLATLLTRAGSTYTNLHVRVPNASTGFYYVTLDKQGDGHLNFASSRLLESRAPKSKIKLEQILGKQIRHKSQ